MALCASLAVTLLPLILSETLAESNVNITILTLPVNLTSWKIHLRDALNRSLSRPLGGVRDSLRRYVQFARKGSIGCSKEGEPCIPGTPSCCPLFEESEEDLQCLQTNGSYYCKRVNDSEELAQERLDALEFGDSTGVLASRPWAFSWEFQSKSEAEREEIQLAEEEEWKKNYKPSNKENFWGKTYKKMKNTGQKFWHDLRKLKKIKEIKEYITDKNKKHDINTENSVESETEHVVPQEDGITPSKELPKSKSTEKDSDENIIRFPDEIPKRENKISFKIDDVIEDALNLLKKKHHQDKSTTNNNNKIEQNPKISSHIVDPLDEIGYSEDKLIEQVNKLKKMRELQKRREEQYQPNEPDIDELIKRQVALILEEERKLDKMRKVEELRRLEHG